MTFSVQHTQLDNTAFLAVSLMALTKVTFVSSLMPIFQMITGKIIAHFSIFQT